ncbi:phosphoribosylglycinamide formyltransferase [Limosilactobacillus reuteri]|uniref:phosphoribosylglycinamide formyltransferase 1 n=1 Tax=Limosilactobacillus reuteri TaxID=1598 RepID=A0A317GK52_LIMRT|nr:phosphoribosylglycinamide formyltransferase [Limosilactobacillus reuteri]MCH5385695.1 phosphoribosylglycinamide formyltransferase [Limosilactobacillus reuteri]PWT49278.1 phosphoribosylglycinamide formyltransferase [Limosilactobacillus reuteri]PWT54127.1 phosphoribosylglycinamide formyltransferase [Limosilactobacillus reuteri]PWT64605.1 phosphoribosylglycinamide formyltransferase [Limosilactobacillus reuteri]
MRVAILASGNGTNFEVLAQHFKNNDLPGELALLFCNHPDAPVMKRAARLGIPAESFTVKSCGGKQEYEEKLLGVLKKYQIDFIALAGYLRVIGPTILDHYAHRIINLHPAWLPEYPGLDSGPIIAQEHVPILPTDTIETLEARVHETEHRLYPEALKQALEKEQH